MWGESVPGRPHRVLLGYIRTLGVFDPSPQDIVDSTFPDAI